MRSPFLDIFSQIFPQELFLTKILSESFDFFLEDPPSDLGWQLFQKHLPSELILPQRLFLSPLKDFLGLSHPTSELLANLFFSIVVLLALLPQLVNPAIQRQLTGQILNSLELKLDGEGVGPPSQHRLFQIEILGGLK